MPPAGARCSRRSGSRSAIFVSSASILTRSRPTRGHTVSVAFFAVLPRAATPQAGSDAAGAEWVDDWRKLTLAFDHAQILDDAEAI